MADTREDRIRHKAHALWEAAGQPDGDHDAHWRQAETEVDAEDAPAPAHPEPVATPAAPAPATAKPVARKPRAAAKPRASKKA